MTDNWIKNRTSSRSSDVGTSRGSSREWMEVLILIRLKWQRAKRNSQWYLLKYLFSNQWLPDISWDKVQNNNHLEHWAETNTL